MPGFDAPISWDLFWLLKKLVPVSAALLWPNVFVLFAFGVEPNRESVGALVDAACASCGLLCPKLKPLRTLDGAAAGDTPKAGAKGFFVS